MRYVTLILVLLITPFSLRSNATGRSWRELFDFADSLVLYGQVDSARTIVNAALSNEISSLGRSDTTVAVFVYEEGVPRSYYFRSYGEAEHLYKRAISAKERMSPSDDVGLAQLLYDAGEFYRDRCWYSKAKPLYERALAIAEAAADSECILIAISLRGLADAYVGLADYDNAHPLYERSLSISNKVFGEKHPHTAACVGGLGRIYLAEREDIKAEEFMMRALAVQKEMLGTDSPHVAGCLINLGFCHYLRGEHEAAESLFTKALPVYERAYGRVHPRVVTALGCLGLCYNYQGKYEQAGSVLTRALVIEESPYGPDQVYVARALENIAICYVDQAKYPQAESRIRRSLAIQEKAYGPHHLDIAGTLNNLAVVCSYQGKLAEVEPLYIRSIEIYRKCLHPEHPSVGMGLVNLGVHYDNQYDYTKALKHYKLGLAILEKTLDPDDNLVASALTNIAEVYRIQGKYVDAEPLYKRALEIKERNYPPEHPELAYAMSNLGQLYLVTGRHVEAQELFEQALTILDRAFEGTHPDADESLWGLAQICINQGEYDRADTYLNRALALMEGTPGLDTCGVSWILEGVSVNRRFQGRPNEAMELAARALTIRRAMFIENASVLSERDAITYSQAMRYSFDNYLSCCTDIGFDDQSVAEDAASKILSCKGEISDGIFERQKALAFAPDSTMTLIHGQLKLVKAELSDLFVEGPCEGRETYWNKVDSLSVLTNVLESKLSRYMASLRLGSVNEEISTSAISSRLPDNTVLVEYVKYQYRQLRPQEYLPKYIAAVISKGESPVIVCLSGASSVDSLVNIYRKHMLDISTTGRITASDQQSYRRIGRELYAAIWKPVSRYVDGKDMVLVAPDGALTMVSFASLLDDNGTYLVERFPVHYLSSGRDLLRLTDRGVSSEGLIAFGAPDYDASLSDRERDLETRAEGQGEQPLSTIKSVRPGCGAFKDIRARPLLGARLEVDLVASAWRDITGEPAIVYTGAAASEDRFKDEAPGHRVIHLATHGYYLGGVCKPQIAQAASSQHLTFVGDHPLLLCGVLLAGANTDPATADSCRADDGILTAYEVSTMDLQGTDLVVLSACETGLGKIQQGEGVYGLRRAFQVAGARTVISALWPLPDGATAEMMDSLYRRHHQSLAASIQRTQLGLISGLRASDRLDHPFIWGGLVAVGEWR